jgi:hypothetical protein
MFKYIGNTFSQAHGLQFLLWLTRGWSGAYAFNDPETSWVRASGVPGGANVLSTPIGKARSSDHPDGTITADFLAVKPQSVQSLK